MRKREPPFPAAGKLRVSMYDEMYESKIMLDTAVGLLAVSDSLASHTPPSAGRLADGLITAAV